MGTESWGSCEESSTVAPSATASATRSAKSVRAVASSPACGSSSNQSAGRRATQRGQRDAAALPGGEPAGRGGAQPSGQTEPLERPVRGRRAQAEGAHGEPDVLRRAEVVVEGGGMAEKADMATHRRVVGGEVDPEHGRLAGRDGKEAGARPQQAGLPSAVRTHDDDHLPGVEGQVHPGEGGKAARESDRGAELDDRGHGLGPPW